MSLDLSNLWNHIFTMETVLIAIAWLCIMLWIFRPGSKKKYDKYSAIPTKDDLRLKPNDFNTHDSIMQNNMKNTKILDINRHKDIDFLKIYNNSKKNIDNNSKTINKDIPKKITKKLKSTIEKSKISKPKTSKYKKNIAKSKTKSKTVDSESINKAFNKKSSIKKKK